MEVTIMYDIKGKEKVYSIKATGNKGAEILNLNGMERILFLSGADSVIIPGGVYYTMIGNVAKMHSPNGKEPVRPMRIVTYRDSDTMISGESNQ